MNEAFWLAVAIATISFGGLSRKDTAYRRIDRIWVPAFLVAVLIAMLFSGSIVAAAVTAIALWSGNLLFWGFAWGSLKGAKLAFKTNRLEKAPPRMGGSSRMPEHLDPIELQQAISDNYHAAARVAREAKYASPGLLQHRLHISYQLSAALLEKFEHNGLVGPADGARPRDVLK